MTHRLAAELRAWLREKEYKDSRRTLGYQEAIRAGKQGKILKRRQRKSRASLNLFSSDEGFIQSVLTKKKGFFGSILNVIF